MGPLYHATKLVKLNQSPTAVKASNMPCNQTCEVKRLSLILKDIKVDKLKIPRASYDLTDQIRRDYPERYEEMTRNLLDIERKTIAGVAELMKVEEEIARGCTTCRESQ